eukprot:433648_1
MAIEPLIQSLKPFSQKYLHNFSSAHTPRFAQNIAALGKNLVTDQMDHLIHIQNIKNEVSNLKRKVTRLLREMELDSEDRITAYKDLDKRMKSYYDGIMKRASHIDKDRDNNFPLHHQHSLKRLNDMGLKLIECDKNMGLELIPINELDTNSYKLLDKVILLPVFEQEQEISKYIILKLKRFTTDFITDHHAGFDIKNQPGYWSFINELNGYIKDNNYPKLPRLRALHKIHKKVFGWRSVVDLGSHPSNFYGEIANRKLSAYIAMYKKKTNYDIILENSLYLKYELNDIDKHRKWKDSRIIQRTADVKAMYDNLSLSHFKKALNWICDFLNILPQIKVGIGQIMDFIFETTFIVYKNKIVKLMDCVATGWIVSPNIANISLLYVEHHTQNTWIDRLFGNDAFHLTFMVNLMTEFRYIDDIHESWETHPDMTDGEMRTVEWVLQRDDGIRYQSEYCESNIILECKVKTTDVFLDASITVDPITNTFHTSIHEKKGKLNTLLHVNSNNAPDHFAAIYSSEMYRSIILNDYLMDHQRFEYKLIEKFKERGWHCAMIRVIRKRFKMQHKHRMKYLAKARKKYNKKQDDLIYEFFYDSTDLDYVWSMEEQQRKMVMKLQNEAESEKIIRFKKVYNRHFDDDRELRCIFKDLMEDLGLLNTKIQLANCINAKLSRFII